METDRKFIDYLFALKDYYQQEIEEYERSLKKAREQLEHINALLLDQLEQQHKRSSTPGQSETVAPAANNAAKEKPTPTPAPSSPQQLSAPLPESASTESTSTPSSATPTSPFVSTATESRQLPVVQSSAQYLSEQLTIPEETRPVQPSATQELLELAADLVTQERSLSATTKRSLLPDDLPAAPNSTLQVRELATSVSTEPAVAEPAAEPGEDSVELSTDSVTGERSPQPSEESVSESTDKGTTERSQPVQLELTPPKNQERSPLATLTKTPLLPPYQHLTKPLAVEKLLRDQEGKILHTEDIIRALHGDLNADEIKAEKPKIYDTLSRGVEKGLWKKVPNLVGCYTMDLKTVEPTKKQPEPLQNISRSSSRRSKYSDSMLPQYRQLKFNEAVAVVVQKKAGQVLTPERVTRELYGDVSAKDLTKFQDQVGKALWAGAKKGWWQRVPGQLGKYTLELKQLT